MVGICSYTDNPMNLKVSQWWPTQVSHIRVIISNLGLSVLTTLLSEVRHIYVATEMTKEC